MPRKMILVGAVVATCALAAVGTALAAGGGSHSKSTIRAGAASAGVPGPPGPGMGGPMRRGVVHSESVVLNRKGDAFITQTTDSGKVQSVDAGAGTITIVESAGSVTYKTVTLTIPANATITLDGNSSSLGSIAAGDHVTVSSSSEGTNVFAADASFRPPGMPRGAPPAGAAPPAGF